MKRFWAWLHRMASRKMGHCICAHDRAGVQWVAWNSHNIPLDPRTVARTRAPSDRYRVGVCPRCHAFHAEQD